MTTSRLALLLILSAGLTLTAQAAYAEQGTSQLTISSQLENGDLVQGKFTELVSDEATVSTGFTPATFLLENNKEYRVGMADYLSYFFNHWLDTGSTDRWRSVTITEDTELIAVYEIQEHSEPEQTIAKDADDGVQTETPGNVSAGGGNGNVHKMFYEPIVNAIAEYDMSDMPEAYESLDYFHDCLSYMGFVHMRELVVHDLNILQQSWLYVQIKPLLDEHFALIGVC